MPLDVIVLAAGMGKRMRSDLPKVLHPLAGRPLLAHVLDAAKALSPRKTIVVHGGAVPADWAGGAKGPVPAQAHRGAGHGPGEGRPAFPHATAAWGLPAEEPGPGHGVMQGMPEVAAEQVVIPYREVAVYRPAT